MSQFGGVAAFEVGDIELFDASVSRNGKETEYQGKGLQKALNDDLLSFLLVELVTHVLAQLVELCLDLALSVSTMKFWRCYNLQLKVSSR